MMIYVDYDWLICFALMDFTVSCDTPLLLVLCIVSSVQTSILAGFQHEQKWNRRTYQSGILNP
ncbi:hypothetical protein BP00DRAFT_258024 [Aspergillus indologenus CBS 114.80]|uniref:Uncharacterized protein n=1 Tax=Aspergillus indologenus CBS 114.80 TaxID=1450541 RepID=A0A2V5HVK1_9EURO|nr:hypothetical protein BP00DRAFT_258024 [Aspergillus indologenus CBS 114.80]